MTNDVLNQIKQTAEFKKIIKDFDPEIIFLGGSRALNQHRVNSDFDLIAYNRNPTPFFKNIKIPLLGTNFHAHCMITSLETIFNMFCEAPEIPSYFHVLIGLAQQVVAFPDHIIYRKAEISSFWDVLQNRKQEFAEIALYKTLLSVPLELKLIATNHHERNLDGKIYYYLLSSYDQIFHENHSTLIHALRSHETLNKAQEKEFYRVFKKIYNFYITFDMNKYNDFLMKLEVENYVNSR